MISFLSSYMLLYSMKRDIIFYTGLPKAAVVRYDRSWFASRLMNNIQLKQSDVIYIPLPLYHGSASLIGMLGALNTGKPYTEL